MADQTRKPSSRFATQVVEKNEAPQLVARPVPRSPTPVGMPAPPAPPIPEPDTEDRQSYDDLEHVAQLDILERERAQLLVRLQDQQEAATELKRENALLRETAPTVVFPPTSIPPPAPAITSPQMPRGPESLPPLDIKALKKAVEGSPLGRAAATMGILIALGVSAYNTARRAIPETRVDGLQARVSQNEQISEKEIEERILEKQRNLQALRAIECWGRQLRGGFQRQGLDMPALPPGGISVYKLGDENPNQPGPPKFVAQEKCPDFPKLPPDPAPR